MRGRNKRIFYNKHHTFKIRELIVNVIILWEKYWIRTRNGLVWGKPKEGRQVVRIKSNEDIEDLKQKMESSRKRTLEDRSLKTQSQAEGQKKPAKEKLKQFQYCK